MTIETGTAPAFASERPIATLDVPIDGRHELSVPLAAWLASIWTIPIRLLHVRPAGDRPALDLDRATAEAKAEWPELPITSEQLDGDDVAAAIVAATTTTSLLVVSTDNANAWAFKNSVAERLVHRAGAPLILLGPQAGPPDQGGDVVVAFDGRPASVAALDAATALAGALGRNLWLVRVVPTPIDGDTATDREIELDLDRRTDALDPAINPRWEIVVSNDPVSAIEVFAAKAGASFVVAGARRRDDATRTTMSSITMGLVANAGRPVLVVGD